MKWLIGFVLAALLGTMAATTIGYFAIGDEEPTATRSTTTSTVAPATTSALPSGPTSAPSGPTTTTSPVAPTTTSRVVGYTVADVSQHASTTSCWLLIDGRVYDVTTYLRSHPGGARTITPWCGKEATEAFATEDGRGEHSTSAYQQLDDYYLGNLVA
jgi:hypothetical protein